MPTINRTALALRVAKLEGGRVNLTIAQIREAQRLVLLLLATEYTDMDVLALLARVRGAARKGKGRR